MCGGRAARALLSQVPGSEAPEEDEALMATASQSSDMLRQSLKTALQQKVRAFALLGMIVLDDGRS